MSTFYATKVDYFYGDGLSLSADEVMGTSDQKYRTDDTIEVAEYDIERGDYYDIYKITDIQTDEDGKVMATVMFIESEY